MDHIAIMRKSWGLLDKIISGNKTIESRWYKTRYPPWGKIKSGDILFFKDSGKPVNVKTRVERVEFISNLWPEKVLNILHEYGQRDGLGIDDIPTYYKMFESKRYCILIFFSSVEIVEPFFIDKSGYGMMSSWITIPDINIIKIPLTEMQQQQQMRPYL